MSDVSALILLNIVDYIKSQLTKHGFDFYVCENTQDSNTRHLILQHDNFEIIVSLDEIDCHDWLYLPFTRTTIINYNCDFMSRIIEFLNDGCDKVY